MDDEKLPRRSYELIELLDQSVPHPQFPTTAVGYGNLSDEALRRLAFLAGARSTVDWLVTTMNDEIAAAEREEAEGGQAVETGADGSPADGPTVRFPRLFGPDGLIRETLSSSKVADDLPE